MSDSPPTFTISQIARALGCSRQNTHRHLAPIPADGEQIVNGQGVKVWRMDSLPPQILGDLAAKAKLKHYPSLAALLSEPFKRYESKVPFAEISPRARDKALKLQRAQRPFISLRNNPDARSADFARRGVDEFRRVFGYSISAKHWRNLFDRTIDRDNGNGEWDHVEIYLEENPPRISPSQQIVIARERGLEILELALGALVGITTLSVEDKDCLWTRACDELRFQIDSGAHQKKSKRAIVKALLASGLFGRDKESVRRNLNRQWATYCKRGGKALIDRRRLREKDPLPQHDFNVIAGHTVARGGDLTAGWEAARASGDLSADTDARHATNVIRVPNRVRRIAPAIKSLLPLAKGERALREDGPSIIGDYSKLFAGEIFEMDDWTPEHVCWKTNEDGRPGFRFLQGQLILVVDVASRRVLEASFTEGAYSARMIRSTLNRACENYCLCDLLNIERGLWKRARLIVGRKGVIGYDQWEMGVRDFMAVKNARRPQAKANIENLFHALGKLMRTTPGWCGNDMRFTMPQELKQKIARAEVGEIHPSEFCLHRNQLFEALIKALAEYNARAQRHGRLQGLSPNEAWHAKQSPTGRPSLGSKAAYLLAYHREPMLVRRSQIVKKIGKIEHVYHSPDVARYDRRTVLVWWNPDDLSQIAISSLDRKEGPFVVPIQSKTLVTAVPDYEAVGRAQARIDETLEVRRAMFRSIQPWLAKARLRPTLVDSSTATFGEKLEADVKDVKRVVDTRKRVLSKTRRLIRERGLNIPVDDSMADGTALGLQLMREAEKESADIPEETA
jgi:hypothetical protein